MERIPIIAILLVAAEVLQFAGALTHADQVTKTVTVFTGLSALLHVAAFYFVWQLVSRLGNEGSSTEQQ